MKNKAGIKQPSSSNKLLNNKILVVDDEQVVIDSIQYHLKREGYEIFSAMNGQEGLKIYNREQPVLIIQDLRMPIMDGIDFLKHIKLKPSDPCFIIVLTGHGDDEDMEKCFKMGISAFLRKPFNLFELLGLVKHFSTVKQYQQKLAIEVEVHKLFLEKCCKYRSQLKDIVDDRSVELMRVNTKLFQEIKEQKVIAETLLERVSEFNTIIDTATDAIVLIDTKRNVTYWNPAAERMFGYTYQEAIGENIQSLVAFKEYREEGLEGVGNILRIIDAAVEGKTVRLLAVKKDGTELVIDVSTSKIVVGEHRQIAGIFRNISKQKEEILSN